MLGFIMTELGSLMLVICSGTEILLDSYLLQRNRHKGPEDYCLSLHSLPPDEAQELLY